MADEEPDVPMAGSEVEDDGPPPLEGDGEAARNEADADAADADAAAADPELDEALTASLVEELGRLKDTANGFFKKGENFEAVEAYDSAIDYADKHAKSDRAKAATKALLISLHNNKAAARLKLEEWDETILSATAALELMASSSDPAIASSKSKALFRRGVAEARLGQLSSAKDDFLAACKADPKDRNARAELAAVQERLKAQKEAEKSQFAQGFAAASEKAVAREEAKEAARKREEDAKKAAEEAALRVEWQAECARLRAEKKAQQEEARAARLRKFDGSAAGAGEGDSSAENEAGLEAMEICDDDGGTKEEAAAAAAAAEEEEEEGAPAAEGKAAETGEGDSDEPITFAAWKEQREQAEKEAKERREKEEKEAKDRAAEERRRARKAEKVELKDEADLKGFQKGYKLRADGTKTSYFDRSHAIDAQTKALLDAQKAPKRLSVGSASSSGASPAGGADADAAVSRQDSAGSAWNNGTTWEEKECFEWAKAALEARLKEVSAAHIGEGGVSGATWLGQATKVKDVEGTASVIATRGTLRHVFEVGFALEFKLTNMSAALEEAGAGTAEGGGEEGGEAGEGGAEGGKAAAKPKKEVVKGTLTYTDVSSSAKDGVLVGAATHAFKAGTNPSDSGAAHGAVEALKGKVRKALEEFDAEFRATKRI